MASLNLRPIRLLGFAHRCDTARLEQALGQLPGPVLHTLPDDDVTAFLQDEPPTPKSRQGRKALLEGLQVVHRRLEAACALGAFLPMDPAHASCTAGQVAPLLEEHWSALTEALSAYGPHQQWDVALRWSAEPVLHSARDSLSKVGASGDRAALAEAVAAVLRRVRDSRATALTEAMAKTTLAQTDSRFATDTDVAITVLVPRLGESAIEQALMAMPAALTEGVEADLRGPMPPVSFHAVRLLRIEQGETARSWQLLGLPEQADAQILHRCWRDRASACHPDRQPLATASSETFADLGRAYQLLRPQLGASRTTLRALSRRNDLHLSVPAMPEAVVIPAELAA